MLPNQFGAHGQFTRLARLRRIAVDETDSGRKNQGSALARSVSGKDDAIASCDSPAFARE
jgi:hypothetical protein